MVINAIFHYFNALEYENLFVTGVLGIGFLSSFFTIRAPQDGNCPNCNGTGKLASNQIRHIKIVRIIVLALSGLGLAYSVIGLTVKFML